MESERGGSGSGSLASTHTDEGQPHSRVLARVAHRVQIDGGCGDRSNEKAHVERACWRMCRRRLLQHRAGDDGGHGGHWMWPRSAAMPSSHHHVPHRR